MSAMRRRAIEGLEAGETFTVTRTFGEEETLAFGAMTRDYNPVHLDDRFAAAKGFPGRICHGLLVGSMLCEIGGQMAMLAGVATHLPLRQCRSSSEHRPNGEQNSTRIWSGGFFTSGAII